MSGEQRCPTCGKSALYEELLSIERLSKLFGVSQDALGSWLKKEDGPPHFKIGGAVRFRPSEVESWLEGKRRQPGVLVNRKRFTALKGGGEG